MTPRKVNSVPEMVCAVKGYRLLVTVSESASEERKRILKAYGAEILLTPGHLGMDGAIEEAYRLAREQPHKYVLVDHCNNEANWQAHCEGTGREIWDATRGKVALDEARTLRTRTIVALLPDGGERYLSTSLFVSETVREPLRFYNTLN